MWKQFQILSIRCHNTTKPFQLASPMHHISMLLYVFLAIYHLILISRLLSVKIVQMINNLIFKTAFVNTQINNLLVILIMKTYILMEITKILQVLSMLKDNSIQIFKCVLQKILSTMPPLTNA
jgi:hypothetical protein